MSQGIADWREKQGETRDGARNWSSARASSGLAQEQARCALQLEQRGTSSECAANGTLRPVNESLIGEALL
jgi:hypothetical protein